MRFTGIAPELLPQMAYTCKAAEIIISGLEYPLNNHLLKLVVLPTPNAADHWRREVVQWLSQIAAIRLKPRNRPGTTRFYFDLLFDGPFGGVETANVASRLQLLAQQYGDLRAGVRPDVLADRLHQFYDAFARGCANQTMTLATINHLIREFETA